MADFGIFTKNADIQARSGTNANATANAVAATDIYVLDIEAQINNETQYNWSDAWTAATLTDDFKEALTEAGACLCAINVIMWDMGSYNSIAEATKMIDILYDRARKAIKFLKDTDVQKLAGRT